VHLQGVASWRGSPGHHTASSNLRPLCPNHRAPGAAPLPESLGHRTPTFMHAPRWASLAAALCLATLRAQATMPTCYFRPPAPARAPPMVVPLAYTHPLRAPPSSVPLACEDGCCTHLHHMPPPLRLAGPRRGPHAVALGWAVQEPHGRALPLQAPQRPSLDVLPRHAQDQQGWKKSNLNLSLCFQFV
jgi:hypothetical protein